MNTTAESLNSDRACLVSDQLKPTFAIDIRPPISFLPRMKLVLYALILLGATLLAFDLAKEINKIEVEPAPEPTQPVRPEAASPAPADADGSDKLDELAQQLAILDAEIEQSPELVEPYLKRAEIHQQMRQYKKAIADLDKASSLSPQDAEIIFQRGYTLIVTGQADKALADFSRALELSPRHTKARLFRAIINYRENKFQAALDDSLELLKQDPTFLDGHITASRCYFELNNKAKAIEHLNTYLAQAIDPSGRQEASRLLELWSQEPDENPANPSTADE